MKCSEHKLIPSEWCRACHDAQLAEEQRLNAMGSEREARLMARVSEIERERDKAHAELAKYKRALDHPVVYANPADAEARAHKMRSALIRCAAAAGLPDAHEACRTVIAIVRAALREG